MGDHRLPLAGLEQALVLVAEVQSAGKLAVAVVAGRSAVADTLVVAGRLVAPPAGLVGRRCSTP